MSARHAAPGGAGFRRTSIVAGRPVPSWILESGLPPEGLCAQAGPELYDLIWSEPDACDGRRPDQRVRAAAKLLCRECPMVSQCLARALASPVTHGVRGGMTYKERQYAARLASDHGALRRPPNPADPALFVASYERVLDWILEHPDLHNIVANRRRNERARQRAGSTLGPPRVRGRLMASGPAWE